MSFNVILTTQQDGRGRGLESDLFDSGSNHLADAWARDTITRWFSPLATTTLHLRVREVMAPGRRKTIVAVLVGANVIAGATVAVLGRLSIHEYFSYELSFAVPLSQAGLLGIWLGLSHKAVARRFSLAAVGLIYLQTLILTFFIEDDIGLRVVVAAVMLIPFLGVAMLMRLIRWWGWELAPTSHHLTDRPGLQFSTRHLLTLTSFFALVLALKHIGVGRSFLSSEIAAFLLCQVCIFAGGVWAALTVGHPRLRIVILFVFTSLVGALFHDYTSFGPPVVVDMSIYWVQILMVVGSLLVIRALGYRLVAHRNGRSQMDS